MKYFILGVNLLLSGYGCSQTINSTENSNNCSCKKDNLLYELKCDTSLKVIACGNLNEIISNTERIVFSPTIINCQTVQPIIDHSEDEIYKYILSFDSNKIKVASTQLILIGNNWEYEIVKDYEQTVCVDYNNQIKLSEPRNVFKFPKLTFKQKKDLRMLCKELKAKIKIPKVSYPFDEKSIYMLYMGFLHNKKESTILLRNIRQFYIIDGAIAETLSEVNL